MFNEKYHRIVFFAGTILLIISLPLSRFLLSIALIFLLLNWVLEGRFSGKWKKLTSSKPLLLFLSLYFIHLVFLLNTQNFTYAFHDLRIKLPILILPLIYGTSAPFDRTEFKIIIQFFICSVLASSLITAFVIFGFSPIDLVDSRYASLFISHIRFALMVVVAIYSLFYLLLFSGYALTRLEQFLYFLLLIWHVCFLILLQSFTGVVIFLAILPPTILWWAFRQPRKGIFRLSLFISLILPFLMLGYLIFSLNRYQAKNIPDTASLPEYSINGSKYINRTDVMEFENGNMVYVTVSREELRKEWNAISDFPYDSLDRKGQKLETTLIRYLSSLGYTKDSIGIYRLGEEDIAMVEKGYTNYIFRNKFSLYPRLYELFWEIEQYMNTGNPSGHSLAQRIEYLKTGLRIARQHFWLGVGTGDIADAFQKQYQIDGSKLMPEWRHRAHNQFLTFFISFGLVGFLIFLASIFLPALLLGRYKEFYFTAVFLIGILSMLNEDTLETHVGVSLIAFFFSFLLFAMPESPTNE